MAEARIGTSGWLYKHWRGRFYPQELPTTRWFEHYAKQFDTVELNNPFYRQPPLSTFEKWRVNAPARFVYAVKLNRYLTHIRRLAVPEDSMERAYGTMAGLGPKAAVVLVQIPPQMKFDAERADAFFAAVAPRRRRHTFEPRHESWLTDEALALLRKHNVALCIQDSGVWPTRDAVTADFVYVRFHGPGKLYSSNYEEGALQEWAARMRAWRGAELDVFAYFNNDYPEYAPYNALRLRELVG